MAFLLPVLEGLGSGLLGNAIGGALGGGTAGNLENSAMNALNSQDESFQLGMYASEIQNQEQLQMQSEVFDQMMDERSENMREVDTLRNVDMASARWMTRSPRSSSSRSPNDKRPAALNAARTYRRGARHACRASCRGCARRFRPRRRAASPHRCTTPSFRL